MDEQLRNTIKELRIKLELAHIVNSDLQRKVSDDGLHSLALFMFDRGMRFFNDNPCNLSMQRTIDVALSDWKIQMETAPPPAPGEE